MAGENGRPDPPKVTPSVIEVNGVFKGGGAKGLAYAGAFQACEEAGIEFVALAGSSAGAITATLIACGYRADEIADLMPAALRSLDAPGVAAIRFFRSSLLANDKLERWLDNALLSRVSSDGPVTFARLKEATGRTLYVVAMDLGARQPVVFSPDVTPDASVASAVVASSAIPVAFPPARMTNGREVVRLVDGGVWSNYPAFVFLDPDFRAAHELTDGAESRRTLGFVLDDDGRPRADPAGLAAATGALLETDHGATARELGSVGAILTSPLLRGAAVVAPIVTFLLALGVLRAQVRSNLSGFRPLPSGLEDLAIVVAYSVVIVAGVISLATSVIVARLGRALADGGVGGAVAAMGVGPSVPYWVGHVRNPHDAATQRHVVVRIPVVDRLSTLTFRPRLDVINEAVRGGYFATRNRLRTSFAVVTRPAAPIRLDAGGLLKPGVVDRVTAWAGALWARLLAWNERKLAELAERDPDAAELKARLRPYVRPLLAALGWMAIVSFLPLSVAFFLELEREGSPRVWTQLALTAPLVMFAVWRYGRSRHRNAATTTTFLRRRRATTLGGLAGASLIAAVLVFGFTVDRNKSISQVLTAERLEGEIVAVDAESRTVDVAFAASAGVATCGIEAGQVIKMNLRPGVDLGDVVEVPFDVETCTVWLGSELESSVVNNVVGIFVAMGLLLGAVNCLLAMLWQRRHRRALAGAFPP